MTTTQGNSIFSVSCGASVLMALYMSMAVFNLYQLMFPLAMIDISSERHFTKSLWTKDDEMHMRVYLSSKKKFTLDFLTSDFSSQEKGETPTTKLASSVALLLWEEELSSPAFTKSFLLTTLDCKDESCNQDESYRSAASWLDHAEHLVREREGGVLSAMSAAGHGIESTSFLLTLYQSLSKNIRSLLGKSSDVDKEDEAILDRTTVSLDPTSPIWSSLQSNSTLYVHVLVLRSDGGLQWPPTSIQEATSAIRRANQMHSLLVGGVNMIKYDTPHHITKPRRVLYNDVVYLFKRYVMNQQQVHPPWNMAYSKPEEYSQHQRALEMKKRGSGYPYWKPEVSIKYVNDEQSYPAHLAGHSGMPLVQVGRNNPKHPTGIAFTPALHVDEMGLTSEKYIPINATVTSLPLHISFDRSDIEHHTRQTTATAGGMSPARWRLLTDLSQAIEAQKQLGFEQSDIDDLRRLIADTNVTLLMITMFASALHLLFEFLTFKSEVSFWKQNKDLTGLSVRSLFLDMIGQTIILFFLIEKESSLLMTVPSAIGCLIALWKCRRAAGLQFVRVSAESKDRPVAWWNWIPRLFGFELRATRLETKVSKDKDSKESAAESLTRLTIESDRVATRTLGTFLLPLVLGYTLYSFVYEEHTGWYSWLITSASSAVYALGFVLMTPQLFLNWKLKSVAHLPWRVLVYKSLNTFIDDLFSFIIRMPTMARISCFRDDIVFFIYLYQRWLYPVDKSRPVEGGHGVPGETATDDKKNQ